MDRQKQFGDRPRGDFGGDRGGRGGRGGYDGDKRGGRGGMEGERRERPAAYGEGDSPFLQRRKD